MYIPIQRYGAEVKYRGSTAHDVERDPGVAEARAEDPVAHEVVDPGEDHDQAADEEVGDGERGQEEIADPPQRPVRAYRHDNQHVAGHRQEYEDQQQQTC